MRIVFLVFLIAFSLPCSGQKLTAGLHSGAGYWGFLLEEQFISENPLHWENGFFLRYESPQWFVLETAAGFYAIDGLDKMAYSDHLFQQMPVRRSDRFYEFSISAQARFTKRQRRLQQYLGWIASAGEQRAELYFNNGRSESWVRDRHFLGSIGFAHTMVYVLFPQLQLSLKSSLSLVGGGSGHFNQELVPRLGVVLGLGYRLSGGE